MGESEIYAKLVTIEKLLIVLASNPKFGSRLADAEAEIYQDFGLELNKMFPSDAGYETLQAVVDNFTQAKRSIEAKIEFLGEAEA